MSGIRPSAVRPRPALCETPTSTGDPRRRSGGLSSSMLLSAGNAFTARPGVDRRSVGRRDADPRGPQPASIEEAAYELGGGVGVAVLDSSLAAYTWALNPVRGVGAGGMDAAGESLSRALEVGSRPPIPVAAAMVAEASDGSSPASTPSSWPASPSSRAAPCWRRSFSAAQNGKIAPPEQLERLRRRSERKSPGRG